MSLFAPVVSFDAITREELNRCLVDWSHLMGPLNRPQYGVAGGAHGLRHHGALVAVTAAETFITAEVCGIPRGNGIELARLCADRPGLCRVALRLWREFVFPAYVEAHRIEWAISYQDADLHLGRTYRFDGWRPIGRSSSGTDPRALADKAAEFAALESAREMRKLKRLYSVA